MDNFYGMLARMKYINRWGLMRNTRTENIAEHSLAVAFIAHSLAVIANTYFNRNLDANEVAVIAMYHDTTEIITGDLPTPIKYYAPDIRDAYKELESVAANQLLKELPQEMRDVYHPILHEQADEYVLKLVKGADKLSALIKCMEEKSTGNTDFDKAYDTIMKSLVDMNIEEVNYFIMHFLPSYNRTIDELN
ncbi:MAG: 5'-deoxynucleotidase [Lachnospiraceae bacterium]|nr:5'-deoxynucleotidase [Lachnospiraceae bacterium]